MDERQCLDLHIIVCEHFLLLDGCQTRLRMRMRRRLSLLQPSEPIVPQFVQTLPELAAHPAVDGEVERVHGQDEHVPVGHAQLYVYIRV